MSNTLLEKCSLYPRYGLSCCDNIVSYASARDIHIHCLVFMSCRQRTSHYIDTTLYSYDFVRNTSEKEQILHKIKVYILLSQGTAVNVHTTEGRFTHGMPFPCHAVLLIHTCHAAPLPCSDSAVSFVKVRVVAGNIRTASPTV
jgi:hypothetical protein